MKRVCVCSGENILTFYNDDDYDVSNVSNKEEMK